MNIRGREGKLLRDYFHFIATDRTGKMLKALCERLMSFAT